MKALKPFRGIKRLYFPMSMAVYHNSCSEEKRTKIELG